MKRFEDRLGELKEENEKGLQPRMVFLLNPKNPRVLEAVIAWTASVVNDFNGIEVEDDCPMEELWKAAEPDMVRFATALGEKLAPAIERFNQLKTLGIIYPDGTVSELASSIVNAYMKKQIENLKK